MKYKITIIKIHLQNILFFNNSTCNPLLQRSSICVFPMGINIYIKKTKD